MDNVTVECPVGPKFGPHGGAQFRSPRYFVCGCDAAYCERHGINRPLGPPMEPGVPHKCRRRHCVTKRKGT